MAIKGKGKTKSRQAPRAPRHEPVVVKKPFAQRGWVRGLVLFLCGVLVLSVTWWAYEGIDKQRNASKAASAQALQREAISAWKVNLEGTLSSVGQVQGGATPQIATDVGTAITNPGTSPATTLKSAPSMPATAITTRHAESSSARSVRRQRPATPTSATSDASIPWKASVRFASVATGMSEVPAQTIPTPAGPGEGRPWSKMAVRETGS